MNFRAALNRTEEFVAAVSLAMVAILIGAQVFSRYVLNSSPEWTEELSRYLFIMAVYIGCSFALKEDQHYAILFARDKLSGRKKTALMLIVQLATIAFCLYCTIVGFKMLQFLAGTAQNSPAMEVKMYWPYAVIPIGFGLTMLRSVAQFWQTVRSL